MYIHTIQENLPERETKPAIDVGGARFVVVGGVFLVHVLRRPLVHLDNEARGGLPPEQRQRERLQQGRHQQPRCH